MPKYDSIVANSIVHLYRGELGRMTMYRLRLDTTTNWAIVVTAGVTTFAFGDPAVTHAVFLFAMLLVYAFLHLESRRFIFYEMSHQRVRLLERFFYQEMLGSSHEENWQQRMMTSLTAPRSPISRLNALGWRLRRNYLWIFGALITAWAVKLDLAGGKARSTAELVDRAEIGPFPGPLVVGLVLLFYSTAIFLAASSSLRYRLELD